MSPPQKEPIDMPSSSKALLDTDKTPLHKSKSLLSSYTWEELFEAAKCLLKSGLPTSAGFICEYAAGLICLRYAGKYGTTTELAGAALGFTWTRMFGVMIISSINQGFSIHAAQLFGAKKYRELGLLLQRNMFVLCLILSAVIMSFFFVEGILGVLGIHPDVAINAGIYIRYSIPSIIGLAFAECMRFYLISQNFFFAQSAIQGGLSFIHIFWCELFVVGFNMPIAGAAIAKSITDISCAGVLYTYISYKKLESWIPWDRGCFQNWFDYLKKMLVIGANMYVEWVSYEISLLIVTMLHDEYALGAHGIALSLLNAIYMWPLGNSATMQAYVGNAVGEGSVKKAQKFMIAGFSLNFVVTAINVIAMLGWNDSIAAFFTNDEQTKQVLQTIIFMYGVGHTVDTCVSHLTGILKILGSERQVLTYFVFFYTIIGVNIEWIFGVALGYGIRAIWAGFIFGMCLMCTWAVIRLSRMDWEKEVAKIQERLGHGHGKDEEKQCYIEMEDI